MILAKSLIKSDETLNGGVHHGSGYFVMALRLSLLGHTPFDETLCPKYSIFSLKNSHFDVFFLCA